MKKTDMVKIMEFPINYPELHVGSVWQTKNRRHYSQRRIIIGINKNRTAVSVRSVTRGPKQHKDQIYTINASIFAQEHNRIQ